jgi:hypothetical protein
MVQILFSRHKHDFISSRDRDACVLFSIYLLVDVVHFISLAHYCLGCVNFNQSNDVFPGTIVTQSTNQKIL